MTLVRRALATLAAATVLVLLATAPALAAPGPEPPLAGEPGTSPS
ncbi:hypothetical protein [Verrucosispora sp. NA02020]|nr:hypothetical protein [Verrucosispora sp. NA02020]